MTTGAAIDVGTNSVRLLVADADPGSPLQDRLRALQITRLGEQVDSTRRLGVAPMERTVAAIAGFVARAREMDAGRIVIGATAAVRDAQNRDEFLAAVFDTTGLTPRILSGDEEAALSFAGAAQSFDPDLWKVVIDIGGGSTEMVAGRADVAAGVSTDAGSVRLTERFVHSDPPSESDLRGVRDAAAEMLGDAASRVSPALSGAVPALIGVAGTFTTLAGVILRLDTYDRTRIHRVVITLDQIRAAREELAAMTTQERGAIAVVTPGRADVIVAGAIVAEEALAAFGAREVSVSETDILDGLVATLL